MTKRPVTVLAEWGIELPNDPETTDEQRDLFRVLQGVDGVSAWVLPRTEVPVPKPTRNRPPLPLRAD